MRFRKEVAASILKELLTTDKQVIRVHDVSKEEFGFHCLMLKDMGLIDAKQSDGGFDSCIAYRVTWKGYSRLSEFCEALGKEYDPNHFVRNF